MAPPLQPSDFLPERTFTGSCHCGTVKYLIRLRLPNFAVDPSDPPSEFILKPNPLATQPPMKTLRIYKCNCTTCHKAGIFHLRLADPGSEFLVLSPLDVGELGSYSLANKDMHWYFCKTCGCRCFTVAGRGLEKAKVNLETWKAGEGGGSAGETKALTEVLKPKDGFAEKPEGSDYLSINANSLDAGQEGLDLREWTEKKWINYCDWLKETGNRRHDKPHPGGLW